MYEDSLALRYMLFMAVNNYSTLFYFAYGARDIDKVAAQLSAILIVTQVLGMVTEYLVPWMRGRRPEAETTLKLKAEAKRRAALRRGKKPPPETEETRPLKASSALVPHSGATAGLTSEEFEPQAGDTALSDELRETLTEARDEILSEKDSISLEFATVVIQFGFVAMFGAAFPLAPVLAFLHNFLQSRLDVWKFTTFVRRPMSERTGGIGTFWMAAFEVRRPPSEMPGPTGGRRTTRGLLWALSPVAVAVAGKCPVFDGGSVHCL